MEFSFLSSVIRLILRAQSPLLDIIEGVLHEQDIKGQVRKIFCFSLSYQSFVQKEGYLGVFSRVRPNFVATGLFAVLIIVANRGAFARDAILIFMILP